MILAGDMVPEGTTLVTLRYAFGPRIMTQPNMLKATIITKELLIHRGTSWMIPSTAMDPGPEILSPAPIIQNCLGSGPEPSLLVLTL